MIIIIILTSPLFMSITKEMTQSDADSRVNTPKARKTWLNDLMISIDCHERQDKIFN